MYIFFIHSSVDGHLGCFHVLAIVDSLLFIILFGLYFLCILYDKCVTICIADIFSQFVTCLFTVEGKNF